MSLSASHCFLSTLLVTIANILIRHVGGVNYYNYNYNPQIPQSPMYYSTPNNCVSVYMATSTCPLETCYYSLTWSRCCVYSFRGSDGMAYKQCLCVAGTQCAPPIDYVSTKPTTTAPTTSTSATVRTTIIPTTTPTTTTTSRTNTPTVTTSTQTTTTPTTTPITTTQTTTLTSTSTTATTTTLFRSLCPSTFRLLNGDVTVNQCDFPGISSISMDQGASTPCNAVYAPATVNGKKKLTFITTSSCKSLIESAKEGIIYDITIGNERLPLMKPIFNLIDGPDGIVFLDVNSWYTTSIKDLGCQKGGCSYNEDTMFGELDYNDCKMVSFGAYDLNSTSKTRLSEAKIAISPMGCTNIVDLGDVPNTSCFRSLSGKNLFCVRDMGAPVYCRARSNGEWILVGITAGQRGCDKTAYIKVIPIPA